MRIMRAVQTLKDAEYLIRELAHNLEVLETRDIDMRKRRVINASPSQNPYDYVVRAELTGGVPTQVKRETERAPAIVEAAPDFDYCVFGVGINSSIAVGDDVTPRHIVAAPFESTAGHGATLVKVYAQMKVPPTGSVLSFRVWKNITETVLFELEIPVGEEDVVTLETFDEDGLEDEDFIGLDILSVGSAGSGLYVKLKYVWD